MKRTKLLPLFAALLMLLAAMLPGFALAADVGAGTVTGSSGSTGRAELIVTAFEFPENLLPGANFEATITIKNIGTWIARRIRLSYSATTDGLFPTNNVHVFPVDNIKPGKTAEIKLALTVRDHTAAGDQQVHIDVSYEDGNFGAFTLTDDFRIETFSESSIDYDQLENGMEITVLEDYTVPANVYNTGYSPVYNVHVELMLPDGQRYMTYYQEIQPGETGSGDIQFFLMYMPDNMSKDGTYPFTYTITYEDALGETHTENRIYGFNVLPQPTEEPQETPEPAKVKTQGQYWMVLLIIVAVSAIVAAVSISAAVVRKTRIK